MRRPLSYANVAATLALFFSMTGGALAARHYLITSTKQIKPSVLKTLRGKRGPIGPKGATGVTGPVGPRGVTGASGAAGLAGAAGSAGSFSTTLSSGQTIRGAYNVGGTAAAATALANTSISYLTLLKQAAEVKIIPVGGTPPAECPGSVELPQAKPGFLCIYEEEVSNTEGLKLNFSRLSGATIFIFSKAAGGFFSVGTWALTAS